MRKEKSTAETYMNLQECMDDLLNHPGLSRSVTYVRLSELCTGSERLMAWAAMELKLAPTRKNLLHSLHHHVQDCKDSDGIISQAFRSFLQNELLYELKRLRTFVLANDSLAS